MGLPADPDRFLVIVNALSSAVGTPSIEGLDISDFEAIVGGDTATILSGAYVQGSYWLVVQAPVKGAAGVYDLTVNLGALATDTNANSVDYTKELKDQVLVIDKSGSMNSPAGNTKIDAAKNAARLSWTQPQTTTSWAWCPSQETWSSLMTTPTRTTCFKSY